MRLSVNYKEAIEKFLQRSLLIYLRFNEDKKKAKKSVENLEKVMEENDDNSKRKDKRKDSLDKIMEENDEDNEDEMVEENEDKASKNGDNNEQKELNKEINKKDNKPTPQNNKANSSDSDSDDENSNHPSSLKKASNKLAKSNDNKDLTKSIDDKKGTGKNKKYDHEKILSLLNNKQKNENEPKDIDKNNNNTKEIKNVERLKGEINKKFMKKLEKLIEFLSKTKIQFDADANPIVLLDKLKKVTEITERNEIIDQIESIVMSLFKNDKKK